MLSQAQHKVHRDEVWFMGPCHPEPDPDPCPQTRNVILNLFQDQGLTNSGPAFWLNSEQGRFCTGLIKGRLKPPLP